jgi:hypothetical protein
MLIFVKIHRGRERGGGQDTTRLVLPTNVNNFALAAKLMASHPPQEQIILRFNTDRV